jgi:hypothetical protein
MPINEYSVTEGYQSRKLKLELLVRSWTSTYKPALAIDRLDWLFGVLYGTSTQDRSIYDNAPQGEPALVNEDSRRLYRQIEMHTITYEALKAML